MADVFSVLSQDHREVETMLGELSGLSGQPRKDLAERLVIEESKHEAVEEMYFWPTVRDRLTDGVALADQAISQENEAKKVLQRIDKAAADDPDLGQMLREFTTAAQAHVAFEEQQVWPQLRSALSPPEAAELGEKVAGAKPSAPTRPHPHTPAAPGVLKTVGGVAAMADRARDSLSDRG